VKSGCLWAAQIYRSNQENCGSQNEDVGGQRINIPRTCRYYSDRTIKRGFMALIWNSGPWRNSKSELQSLRKWNGASTREIYQQNWWMRIRRKTASTSQEADSLSERWTLAPDGVYGGGILFWSKILTKHRRQRCDSSGDIGAGGKLSCTPAFMGDDGWRVPLTWKVERRRNSRRHQRQRYYTRPTDDDSLQPATIHWEVFLL
jgi:hypothetical protein